MFCNAMLLFMIVNSIFVALLTLLSAFDFFQRRLPNILVLLLALTGFYAAWLAGDFASKLIAGAVGFLAFYLIRSTYKHLRRTDGLGMGDVKLMGAVGLWVGLVGLPLVVLGGSLLTLIYALILRLSGRELTNTTRLPLGAFLCLATGLIYYFLLPA